MTDWQIRVQHTDGWLEAMPVDISGRPADIDGNGLHVPRSLPTMRALDAVAAYLTVVHSSGWAASIKPSHNET